jgi:hypothetical protein
LGESSESESSLCSKSTRILGHYLLLNVPVFIVPIKPKPWLTVSEPSIFRCVPLYKVSSLSFTNPIPVPDSYRHGCSIVVASSLVDLYITSSITSFERPRFSSSLSISKQ